MVSHAARTDLVLICFVLAVLCSCAPSIAKVDHTKLSHRKQPRINISELEKKIHYLINKERRKIGLPSLVWDDTLSRIAKKHSSDMAKRAFFSHNSPEGHDFLYRYRQGGYLCAVRMDDTIYGGAENIFQNNLYDAVTTVNGEAFYDWNSPEKIAETTVQGWMKSAGHRKNILMPYWKNEGIGVVIAPDDKVYITQNFC